MSSDDNPYQYFDNESTPFEEQQNKPPSGSHPFYSYADPSTITSVIVLTLIITLVIDSAGAFTSLWEAVVLQNIQSDTYETVETMQAAADASDMRVTIVGLLQSFAATILGIVFLFWT